MKIISDTSACYSPEEGKELGIDVLPLSVTINNQTYTEYEEISSRELLDKIAEGGIPSSSQPSIGRTIETFGKYPDEEILVLTMADGLSGTYQTTVSAKESVDNKNIHVLNTRTLCGPHRHLLEVAIKLKDEGKDINTILQELHKRIAFHKSFLVPADFDFLKRGGRLSPLAAKIGGMLKVVPVLVLREDAKKLDKFGIKRTVRAAVKDIIKCYQEMGVGKDDMIYITHACLGEKADKIADMFKNAFPDTEVLKLELSPVFITQGGPGCFAVQMIRR